MEYDVGTDGTSDEVWVLHFNEYSEWRRTEWDRNADGRADSLGLLFYDSDGKLIREAVDGNADGSTDVLYHYYYERGLLKKRDVDTDVDGQPDWWTTWVHDAEGRLKVHSLREASGRTKVTRYYYDDIGDMVRIERDFNNDGQIDSLAQWIWQDGLLIEVQSDWGADGSVDALTRFEYAERHLQRAWRGNSQVDEYTYERGTGWLSTWQYRIGGLLEHGEVYRYDTAGRLEATVVTDWRGQHLITYWNECRPWERGERDSAGFGPAAATWSRGDGEPSRRPRLSLEALWTHAPALEVFDRARHGGARAAKPGAHLGVMRKARQAHELDMWWSR